MIEFIIILTSYIIYTNYFSLYIINEINNEYKYDNICDFRYNYINYTNTNNFFNNTYLYNKRNIYKNKYNEKHNNIIMYNDIELNNYDNIYNFNNIYYNKEKLENYLKYKYLYDNRGCNCNKIKIDIFICYYYDNLYNLELDKKSIKIYIKENLVSLYPYTLYKHNIETLRKILKKIKIYNIELYYKNYKNLLKKTYTTDLLNTIKNSYNIIKNLWF